MRQFIFADAPNFFSPWPAKYDRGQALEAAWRENLGGALDRKLADLREGEQEGWRPSLVFTPMMIEDGRRLIVSNFSMFGPISNDGRVVDFTEKSLRNKLAKRCVPGDVANEFLSDPKLSWGFVSDQIDQFDWMEENPSRRPLTTDNRFASLRTAIRKKAELVDNFKKDGQYQGNYSIEALQLFRLFPEAQNQLKLSTAVRMSASFPFFTPAVSLPTWPRRRVVDAGYYDNYGVSLSASWLFSGQNKPWLFEDQKISRVCIIQIRDGIDDDYRRLERVRPNRSTELSRAAEEFLSPLEGLDNARVSSSSFRNDGQLELLNTYLSEKGVKFLVADFEFTGRASLNWRLSAGEKAELEERAGLRLSPKGRDTGREIRERIAHLLDFLYPAEGRAAEALPTASRR
jgi:hypothetical protein